MANAQVAPDMPLRLTHVTGYVINRSGKPVANAEITLSQDDAVIYRTRTDQSGAFKFDRLSGKYVFRVARTEDAPAAHEIVVTPEIVTALQRKKLYVILGPGACADECSTVTTSKREFDRVIRKKTKE